MSADSNAVARPLAHANPTTRPATIVTVMLWELRRYAARRASWVMLGAVLAFFMFLMWYMRGISISTYFMPEPASVTLSGTSAWGMIRTIPRVMLLAFGMFLPFLAAGSVAHDLKQRTHEILMSTPVSTTAYVWGRYLAVLVAGLGMALLMLVAIFIVGFTLHLGTDYPPPNVVAAVSLWATIVLPAMMLNVALSFALGVLLPRFSNPVKIVVLTAWFLSVYLATPQVAPDWYAAWDPTSRTMSYELEGQYMPESGLAFVFRFPESRADLEEIRQAVRVMEQGFPDLLPWVPPKLVYVALGFALVALARARFQRFRDLKH